MPPLTLEAHLASLVPGNSRPALTTQVLPALLHTLPAIAAALARTSVSTAGSANPFGDAQLNVDVLAESLLRSTLASLPCVATASSEEDPVERSKPTLPSGETYTVAFDPLDGSSIIGPNWSVGTILGIWDGASALSSTDTPRTRQIASILGVLGPRTTAVVALRLPGTTGSCFEVALHDGGVHVSRPEVRFSSKEDVKTRYFAPANLRAAAEAPAYLDLVSHFIREKYTLRYSGGLVPDIYHALVKGHGVYVSPVTEKSPAKLRRLYELAPVALVVECAGGVALDARDGQGVLDTPVREPDERGGLVCGSAEDVEFVRGRLLG